MSEDADLMEADREKADAPMFAGTELAFRK
jgi:hypothetical protein